MSQHFDLEPKKWPKQARSQATFDALVEGCTRVLPRLGYAGTSTNHIAEESGIGIASLYEYFPGKDAIIAQVANRVSEKTLIKLAEKAQAIWGAPTKSLMQLWLEAIHETLLEDQEIYRIFMHEIPFHSQLSSEALAQRVFQMAEQIETGALSILPRKQTKASMHLIVNLVVSTLTQLAFSPPADISKEEILKELANKLNGWILE